MLPLKGKSGLFASKIARNLVIAGVLSGGIAFISVEKPVVSSYCHFDKKLIPDVELKALEAVAVCSQGESSITWLAWFSGKSSSYQFHFFDLLELLYSGSERS